MYEVRACLSRGKRIVPVMDPELLQQSSSSGHQSGGSGLPSGGGPGGRDPSASASDAANPDRILSRGEELERDEKLFCPGGRLLSLNVSGDDIGMSAGASAQVHVPFPAAGTWFLTILPTCSRLYSFHAQPNRPNM